jgi:DEAD/DEAH box helicase domain-containing protein
MKKYPLVFDLETKYNFRDFDDHKKLGVTVVSSYDYANGKSNIFLEKEINSLFPLLENASYLIGFNIKSFDLKVLSPYYPGNIDNFSVFDILDDIKEKIGFRLSLNDVVNATLGKKKSGHGLMAIELYKEGKIKELCQYCLDDTMLTKELFEYGVKNSEIYYLTPTGRATIKVNWRKYFEEETKNDMHLTLPYLKKIHFFDIIYL